MNKDEKKEKKFFYSILTIFLFFFLLYILLVRNDYKKLSLMFVVDFLLHLIKEFLNVELIINLIINIHFKILREYPSII